MKDSNRDLFDRYMAKEKLLVSSRPDVGGSHSSGELGVSQGSNIFWIYLICQWKWEDRDTSQVSECSESQLAL